MNSQDISVNSSGELFKVGRTGKIMEDSSEVSGLPNNVDILGDFQAARKLFAVAWRP